MAYVRAELVESVDDLIRGGGLEVVKKQYLVATSTRRSP